MGEGRPLPSIWEKRTSCAGPTPDLRQDARALAELGPVGFKASCRVVGPAQPNKAHLHGLRVSVPFPALLGAKGKTPA